MCSGGHFGVSCDCDCSPPSQQLGLHQGLEHVLCVVYMYFTTHVHHVLVLSWCEGISCVIIHVCMHSMLHVLNQIFCPSRSRRGLDISGEVSFPSRPKLRWQSLGATIHGNHSGRIPTKASGVGLEKLWLVSYLLCCLLYTLCFDYCEMFALLKHTLSKCLHCWLQYRTHSHDSCLVHICLLLLPVWAFLSIDHEIITEFIYGSSMCPCEDIVNMILCFWLVSYKFDACIVCQGLHILSRPIAWCVV